MLNRIIRQIKDVKYDIKVWFQRAFRGYADIDWFDYDGQNSRRAVRLLTLLRDDPHCGAPSGISGMNTVPITGDEPSPDEIKWKSMIDDMIFFHKCVAGFERPESERYKTTVDVTKGSIWNLLCPDGILHHNSYCTHMFKDEEEQRRYRRGKYYYGRYYECLWS